MKIIQFYDIQCLSIVISFFSVFGIYEFVLSICKGLGNSEFFAVGKCSLLFWSILLLINSFYGMFNLYCLTYTT